MAKTTLNSISVMVRLDNGMDWEGNTKTVGISLGNISKRNFDGDKVLAIVNAMKPCLSKTVEATEKIEVYTIERN